MVDISDLVSVIGQFSVSSGNRQRPGKAIAVVAAAFFSLLVIGEGIWLLLNGIKLGGATFLAMGLMICAAASMKLREGLRGARQLRRRQENECLKCGYSLKGIVADRCPECGEGSDHTAKM